MQSTDAQQEFYNRRWADWRYINDLKLARCRAILGLVAELRLREPQIIDLGCGTGWLTSILGLIGPTTGVDLSDLATKEASTKYPHVCFLQADILNWRFPHSAFDICISQEVIEHVPDQTEYLNVAHGLLRPGGYLILTTPNASTFYAMRPEQWQSWSNQPIENWLTIKQLSSLVQRQFNIEKLTTVAGGYGHKGIRRIINSTRLRAALSKFQLYSTFDNACLRFGFGLHTVLLAKRIDMS